MTAKIKLNAASGGGSISIQAPSSTSNNRVFTLPDVADATLLTSNSSTGKILQVQSTTKTDTFTHSNLAESTFSNAPMSVSITPSNASNKILIRVEAVVSTFVADTRISMGIFKDGSIISGAKGDASGNRNPATTETYQAIQASAETISAEYLDTAGGTSQITYDIRFMHSQGNGANLYLNRSGLDHNSIGYYRTVSTMTAMEIAA